MKIVFIYTDRQPQMVEVNSNVWAVEINVDCYNDPVVHEVGINGQTATVDLRNAVKGWIPE